MEGCLKKIGIIFAVKQTGDSAESVSGERFASPWDLKPAPVE